MKKTVYTMSVCSVLLTVLFTALYMKLGIGAAYSLAVTFGTIGYHFLMRLAVGYVINAVMKNKADYTKSRCRCRGWEKKLYKRLNVKSWKRLVPTYAPELFDPKKHTWDEIAQAMCQAEIVHEVIAVLSFVPVAFAGLFGASVVFIITSVCAAAFDMMFVIVQRYNRPRVIRLIK